jgi:hypothetical protein
MRFASGARGTFSEVFFFMHEGNLNGRSIYWIELHMPGLVSSERRTRNILVYVILVSQHRFILQGAGCSVVVEALRYKPEGRGFETP